MRVHCATILQECLLEAASAAVASGITLRGVDPASARVKVQGDPRRLKQVNHNLVLNAFKYMASGGAVRPSLMGRDMQ